MNKGRSNKLNGSGAAESRRGINNTLLYPCTHQITVRESAPLFLFSRRESCKVIKPQVLLISRGIINAHAY